MVNSRATGGARKRRPGQGKTVVVAPVALPKRAPSRNRKQGLLLPRLTTRDGAEKVFGVGRRQGELVALKKTKASHDFFARLSLEIIRQGGGKLQPVEVQIEKICRRSNNRDAHGSEQENTLSTTIEDHHAAIEIQRAWRGFLARKQVWGHEGIAEHAAACLVQRVYRGRRGFRVGRKLLRKKRRKAAICIQKAVRGKIGRRIAREKRQLEETNAAILLQRNIRIPLAKQRVQQMREAYRGKCASTLQRFIRGRLGRIFCKQLRQGQKHRLESARQLAMEAFEATQGEFDFLADQEICASGRIQDKILNRALVLHSILNDRRNAMRLYTRLMSCARSEVSIRSMFAKAVAMIGEGMTLEAILEVLFDAERCAEKHSESSLHAHEKQTRNRTDQDNHVFYDISENFFFVATQMKRGQFDEHVSLVNFALVQGCILRNSRRAEIYWRRALELKENDWVSRLHHQFRNFWNVPRCLLCPQVRSNAAKNLTMSILIQGDIGVLKAYGEGIATPLVVALDELLQLFPDASRKDAHMGKLLLQLASLALLIRRSKTRQAIVAPQLERLRDKERQRAKQLDAALLIQRLARGMKARNVSRNLLRIERERRRQMVGLLEKRRRREVMKLARRTAAVKIQSLCRRFLVRVMLYKQNAGAKEMQRLVRGHLGRIYAEEYERRQRMGALVETIFCECKEISGRSVQLTVLKSGYNYRCIAFDPTNCQEYHGLFREQDMELLMRTHPCGVDGKTMKVRKNQYGRVLNLLLSKLVLVEPIKAPGDLGLLEKKFTIIADLSHVFYSKG